METTTCARCGHDRRVHVRSDALAGGADHWGQCCKCPCPVFSERIDPSPPMSIDDFDHGDDDGNPGA